MARELYAAQVALLVRILPFVAAEEEFALKGGTAINLFYRDLPRLSVDIDLTYLPIKDRAESLAETQVVSFEDLYGGKLHAALDRQHPRDLYDVKLLYENEGLTDALFRTFLIYVASSLRPAHELLNPNFANLEQPFAQEFLGMTKETVSLDALINVRARLIDDIQSRLDDAAQAFLLSLQDATPDFDVIGLPQAACLPAVKWKLLNLQS